MRSTWEGRPIAGKRTAAAPVSNPPLRQRGTDRSWPEPLCVCVIVARTALHQLGRRLSPLFRHGSFLRRRWNGICSPGGCTQGKQKGKRARLPNNVRKAGSTEEVDATGQFATEHFKVYPARRCTSGVPVLGPGQIAFTVIPVFAHSIAKVRVNPRSPCLEAE